MSWKGTKENVSSLPQSGNQTGDLWHVNEDGNEYAWDGSKWEALGGISGQDGFSPTPRVQMTLSDTTPSLEANKFYVFPEMATLTPTFVTPTDNSIINEYHFIFTSGATATTLTLPASVLQPDGFTVEVNHVYEVSILENCMTAQGWAVSA